MAFWITHLRICDALLPLLSNIDEDAFIVGSLAPDSGRLNPDMLTYTPSRHILHHTSEDGKTIFYSRFAAQYLTGSDAHRLSFLYGYYSHLYTDHIWATEVYLPLVDANRKRIKSESGFRRYMKGTVESCDRVYLKAHRVESLERLNGMGDFCGDYPDYISPGQINGKLGEIREYYSHIEDDYTADETYFSCSALDGFIAGVSRALSEDTVTRNIIGVLSRI